MTTDNKTAEASCEVGITGRVVTRIWDSDALERHYPAWPELSKAAKLSYLSEPSEWPVAPDHVGHSTNVVLDNYLEALASGDSPQPTHLAISDDDTEPSGSDEEMPGEVFRTALGQDEGDGRDRLTSTLIGQDEANGHDLVKVGFANGPDPDDSEHLTANLLPESDRVEPKTSDVTVQYDYILEYKRVD